MKSNRVTIDGQDYLFEAQISNSSFSVQIPYDKVIDLTIVESLYATFPYGSITIDNTEDLIESFTSPIADEHGNTRDGSFVWHEDGTDFITIKILPVASTANDTNTQQLFPPDIYMMDFLFSIVAEEVYATTTNQKGKKLTLLDVREMALLEKTTPWSTNKALVEEVDTSMNLTHKSNDDRKVKTGLAIKNFLKTLFGDVQPFTEGWDQGKTKVFYSNPGTSSDMSTLVSLLDSHVSETSNDNCLLRCERDGRLSFASYEDYFKNALVKIGPRKKGPGPLLIDAFSLPYQGGVSEVQSTKSAGLETVDETYDVKSSTYVPPASRMSYDIGEGKTWSDFEGVEGYAFSNFFIPGSVSEFASIHVHNVDTKDKQFNIDIKNNNFENVQKEFKKLYVDHFHGQSGKPKEIFPSNTLKTGNNIINNVFTNSTDSEYRIKAGRNSLLAKAIGYAPALTIEVPGSTPRIPGRFLTLFGAPGVDTNLQDKLQGEWFILNMVHTFTPGKYKNTITCTKHYSFK